MANQTLTVQIHGDCATGFEPVRRAFEENFHARGELGAAFAVTHNGETVVDLWAGWADAGWTRLWEADTLTNVWSTTKGAVAVCAHQLAERGLLDLDAPVARYWPEFAAAGKQDIPVRWLLSHRSGVTSVGIDHPIGIETVLDWDAMTALLASQAPHFEPGTASGYQAMSFGFMVGEVIRRITGQPVGTYFQENVAGPLGLDFHIGLPGSEHARFSEMVEPVLTSEAASALATAFANASPIALAALVNPRIEGHHTNDPAWRSAQIPAANGHATARAIASLYGALTDGSLLSQETVDIARTGQCREVDLVGSLGNECALGFYPGSEEKEFGPNPRAFGHDGFGGSTGGADPESGIAFGYTMNQMGPLLRDDHRKMALVNAVFASLAG